MVKFYIGPRLTKTKQLKTPNKIKTNVQRLSSGSLSSSDLVDRNLPLTGWALGTSKALRDMSSEHLNRPSYVLY